MLLLRRPVGGRTMEAMDLKRSRPGLPLLRWALPPALAVHLAAREVARRTEAPAARPEAPAAPAAAIAARPGKTRAGSEGRVGKARAREVHGERAHKPAAVSG